MRIPSYLNLFIKYLLVTVKKALRIQRWAKLIIVSIFIRTTIYSWQVLPVWGTELLSHDSLNCMVLSIAFSIPKWCCFFSVYIVVFLMCTIVQNQQLLLFYQHTVKLFQHILLPHILVSWKQSQNWIFTMGELSNFNGNRMGLFS